MFTASSAPVTSRCRPRWSTIFCFCGPLRRSPRVFLRLFGPCFPGLSAVLLGPRGVRSSFGASRSSCVPSGPAGPSSPSRRLVAPRAPRLSLRTCRLTPARCSALPRAPPAALLCFVRGLLRPALRRLACSSRRSACGAPLLCAGAFASRSSPSCVFLAPLRLRRSFVFLPCFFLLPAAGGGVAPLPFVPVPLLPFRQSGPRLRLCLSSRLWRLFSSPLFLLPFSFPCPSPLATFSLPLLLSCPLSLGHSYGCFWDIFFFLLFMVRLSHGRGEGEGIE